MKAIISLAANLAGAFLIAVLAVADTPFKASDVPSTSWESHASGALLALTVTSQDVQGVSKSFLCIFLKNNSSGVKEYFVEGSHWNVRILALDDAGAWQPLHEGASNDQKLGHITASPQRENLGVGETVSCAFELSPTDLATIKGHRVKARFIVYDATTQQKSVVEFTPKILIGGP